MFDEEELGELKNFIRNFTEGKIQEKELKQKLLLCRGRIVEDISSFLCFCIDRVREGDQSSNNRESTDLNQLMYVNDQLKSEISEKDELLKAVAEKVNSMSKNIRK